MRKLILDKNNLIKSVIEKSKKITIISHVNPDGDAVGSSLALWQVLKNRGNNDVKVVTPSRYPDFLVWLSGGDNVIVGNKDFNFAKDTIESSDLLVLVDFSTIDRTGCLESLIKNSNAIKIHIDHHLYTDSFADYIITDTSYSSTSEMIWELLSEWNYHKYINKEVAEAIYVGLMTDTGSFSYSNTNERSHKIAAELFNCGIDVQQIYSKVYCTYSYDRMKLLGYVLNEKMKLLKEYKVCYITLSLAELNRFNYKTGDTEGFVNYGLMIDDIILSVLFIEKKDYIKISFRSKGEFSAGDFAKKYFNGGGHRNASGGLFYGSMEECVNKFIEIVKNLSNGA